MATVSVSLCSADQGLRSSGEVGLVEFSWWAAPGSKPAPRGSVLKHLPHLPCECSRFGKEEPATWFFKKSSSVYSHRLTFLHLPEIRKHSGCIVFLPAGPRIFPNAGFLVAW